MQHRRKWARTRTIRAASVRTSLSRAAKRSCPITLSRSVAFTTRSFGVSACTLLNKLPFCWWNSASTAWIPPLIEHTKFECNKVLVFTKNICEIYQRSVNCRSIAVALISCNTGRLIVQEALTHIHTLHSGKQLFAVPLPSVPLARLNLAKTLHDVCDNIGTRNNFILNIKFHFMTYFSRQSSLS